MLTNLLHFGAAHPYGFGFCAFVVLAVLVYSILFKTSVVMSEPQNTEAETISMLGYTTYPDGSRGFTECCGSYTIAGVGEFSLWVAYAQSRKCSKGRARELQIAVYLLPPDCQVAPRSLPKKERVCLGMEWIHESDYARILAFANECLERHVQVNGPTIPAVVLEGV